MIGKLAEFKEFQLVPYEVDVRGWKVYDKDSREAGTVDSMIVDTNREKITHFGIKVGDRVRMIPLEQVMINWNDKEILLPDVTADQLDRYVEYEKGPDLAERERQYYVTFLSEGETTVCEKICFEDSTVKDLMSTEMNKMDNEERMVSIEGSFGHNEEDRWETDEAIFLGYKIWDHEGNGIRVNNVFAALDKETKQISLCNEFKPEVRQALVFRYGTYARIDGIYRPFALEDGEPAIDVLFINGKPITDFICGK
ncbi:MAG TPA: hypothetical protein DD435_07320 [Cyanobacteria bacterium UBA8530]|nr:hypothetical protein [Cyanobacteria bacterium UBA8530]